MKPGALAAIIIVGGVAATVARQLPEIRRYLKIESM
ncbi:MAG: DUF6893 family small protein [Solirubrobacteraceae bacterium]|jgi:hypothetical protein